MAEQPPARQSGSTMNWLEYGNRLIRRALHARGVTSQTCHLRGVDLHTYRYRGTGKGPPLLLVHGLGSSANAFFRTIIPLGATFREVWAPDLPGNGFSPVPAGGPLPLLEHLEVLLEFRRSVVGEPVFLVGNSLGGAMSLSAASQEPASFVGLALVSPAGAKLSPAQLEVVTRAFQVSTAKEARGLAHKLYARPPLAVLLFADELRKMVSTDTVQSIVRGVSPADAITEEMLARITMPSLLLWGRSDKLLPRESVDYFRAHLPTSAEITEVEGFGHMPQMEHPRQFVERLADFARRHALA